MLAVAIWVGPVQAATILSLLSDNMVRFNSSNISDVKQTRPFTSLNSTVWGTVDVLGGRYFLAEASGEVLVFNSTTLSELPELSWSPLVSGLDEPPASCHYEPQTDLLWLTWTKVMPDGSILTNKFCSMPSSPLSGGSFHCFPFGHGQDDYLYVPDASAYDSAQNLVWQQVYNNAGRLLFAFDTTSKRIVSEVPVKGLCQGMQVAFVDGESQLVCVLYGDLVQVSCFFANLLCNTALQNLNSLQF